MTSNFSIATLEILGTPIFVKNIAWSLTNLKNKTKQTEKKNPTDSLNKSSSQFFPFIRVYMQVYESKKL